MKKFLAILTLLFFFCSNAFAKEGIELKTPEAGIYIFKINTKKYKNKIKPFISTKLKTPRRIYKDNCVHLVVNGGFFDVENGKSVSYVVINNEEVSEIEKNITFLEQIKAEDRLDNVLNRGEFRILENKRGKLKYDIAFHNDPIQKGYKIKHSLQAGPIMLPTMDLVQEGFVKYEEGMVKFQSADVLKRRERTAIALKGKYLYVILFTKEHKADINELKDYIQNELKIKRALAFDGGLSTAFNYENLSVGSVGKYQRRVKSFLVIER